MARGAIIAKVLGGQPLGETAFGLSAAKKDLVMAIGFAASLHAELPVAASALACFEEAEAAGLGEADATAVSTRWPQRLRSGARHSDTRPQLPSLIDKRQANPMIDSKNRYGRTAARIHDADGLARRPTSPTIDIHAHIVVPQAAALAQPHVDPARIPLAHFADEVTKGVNAQQEKDVREVMTTIDRRLSHLDRMGIDVQVVAPAPNQCYYSLDAKIGKLRIASPTMAWRNIARASRTDLSV